MGRGQCVRGGKWPQGRAGTRTRIRSERPGTCPTSPEVGFKLARTAFRSATYVGLYISAHGAALQILEMLNALTYPTPSA